MRKDFLFEVGQAVHIGYDGRQGKVVDRVAAGAISRCNSYRVEWTATDGAPIMGWIAEDALEPCKG